MTVVATRRSRAARLAVLVGAALATSWSSAGSASSAPPASIELRGGAPALRGTVQSVGPEGVTIGVDRGGVVQPRTVPWSEVRSIHPADAKAQRWLPAGESLWRARIRVMRGDWPLAAEPFRAAAEAWRGASPCADGAFAAAGAAESALRAGRPEDGAVDAFEAIRVMRAMTAGQAAAAPVTAAGESMRVVDARIADPAVPLSAMFPPHAMAPDAATAASRSVRGWASATGGAVADVATAWARAAQSTDPGAVAAIAPADATARDDGSRAAIAALEAIAACRGGVADTRWSGLSALGRVRRAMPAWFDAWARLAAAQALLVDADEAVRSRGAVLLVSLVACDAAEHPMLAQRADALLRSPPAAGTESVAAMLNGASGAATRADVTVPRDRADRTTAAIESRGRLDLLVAHLESQVDRELEGPSRQALVERLATALASLLEREPDAARRDALVARAGALLRGLDPGDPGGDALRLVLLRAQYRSMQRDAEEWRAGRIDRGEAESVRTRAVGLVTEFGTLASRAGQAQERSERGATRSSGADAERLDRVAGRSEDVMRSAQFFRAWSAYYAAWLGRELGVDDWRDRANAALAWFAALIEPGRVAVTPEEVSVDLRGNEGFASALLGMGQVAGLVQSSGTSDAWLALLDEPRTHPAIRNKLDAWRMASLVDRGDLAGAVALLGRSGDGPQGVPMALIAAAGAARAPDRPGADALLTEAVARLATAGKLRELALVGASPTNAAGPGAALFVAVRAASDAQRLQSAGESDAAAARWRVAAEAIAEATAAGAPGAIISGARALQGHILRGAGRPAEAADAFIVAADLLSGDRASEARWMAVTSLEAAGSIDRARAQADRLVTEAPESIAGVRARAWRVAAAEVPSAEDIDALLGGGVPMELAGAARRAAMDALYRRFRASDGVERTASARRALAVADDEPAAAGPVGTVDVRRRLEMAVAVRDAPRARQALDALAARAGQDPALADERAARAAQVAALEGRLLEAMDWLDRVDAASPWSRVAATTVLAAVGSSVRAPAELRARVSKRLADAPDAGSALPVGALLAWIEAEAQLARSGHAGVDRRGAIAAADRAVTAHPRDIPLALAAADFAAATGREARAQELVQRALSAEPVGSEGWLLAKAVQLEAMSVTDGPRARQMLDQVRQLTGGLGSGPGGDRLRSLDATLPAAGGGS